ncbi:MAG: hypothetical protein KC621_26035 [Myxococcales bacterium]|nr:hypothetical protein [Myxococcales bacterium]
MRRLLLLVTMVSACADKDWKAAIEADSSYAFLTYAQANPGTAKANQAYRRAEELSWEEAVAANTSTAFEAYAGQWPDGERAQTARTRAESLAWDEAAASGSAAAWTAYLARYGGSPRKAEAEARLEDAVFESARKENTEISWGRYLLRYPEGQHAAEASALRELLGWQVAVQADTPKAYQDFLRRYEGGTHTAEARAWLDATLVTTLQPVIVLRGTWQSDRMRATILKRYQSSFDRLVGGSLKREFKVLPTKTVDLAKTPMAHPHELFPPQPDQGLVVMEITEREGRSFEPSGHATDVEGRISLYAPNTKTPVVDAEVRGSTPEVIHGIDESALHTTAVTSACEAAAPSVDAIVAFKRKVVR